MSPRRPALRIGVGLLGAISAAAVLLPAAAELAQPDSGPAPGAAGSYALEPGRVLPAAAPPAEPPAASTQARPRGHFDDALDALVRDGVVSPAERARVRSTAGSRPQDAQALRRACMSGAISDQECRSGVVVRLRGRSNGAGEATGALSGESARLESLRLGADGRPLPPLTVPVSALLAGGDGTFRLQDVFGVTPRPAPIAGNGNRRLLFPVLGSAIPSSSFGFRLHPVLGIWRLHAGQDLAAPEGTPVVAALSGRVVSSGLAGGYGLAIEVEHANPRRRTLYGHLSELYVKQGDRVRQGEVIGRVGSTGLSTGPHLHFELRMPQAGGWVAVDPGDLDPGPGAIGTDAIALLMGQLLGSLERPAPAGAGKPPG